MRILIIKTGYNETFKPDYSYPAISYGDILRSTVLLHIFKNDEVHWLTDSKAIPLLAGLNQINNIHIMSTIDLCDLKVYYWDKIINLEKSRKMCRLTESLSNEHTEIVGYYLKDKEILLTRKYKDLSWSKKLFSLFDKEWNGENYYIPHEKDIKVKRNLIFLNKEVGKKIPEKRWNRWDGLEKLIKLSGLEVTSQKSFDISVYIKEIQISKFIISTDSLGLHIAIALNKSVLGLFGPTDHREISGLSEAIQVKDLKSLTALKVYKRFNCLWKS